MCILIQFTDRTVNKTTTNTSLDNYKPNLASGCKTVSVITGCNTRVFQGCKTRAFSWLISLCCNDVKHVDGRVKHIKVSADLIQNMARTKFTLLSVPYLWPIWGGPDCLPSRVSPNVEKYSDSVSDRER